MPCGNRHALSQASTGGLLPCASPALRALRTELVFDSPCAPKKETPQTARADDTTILTYASRKSAQRFSPCRTRFSLSRYATGISLPKPASRSARSLWSSCSSPHQNQNRVPIRGLCFGAGDRTRTGTLFPARDFKSLASTNSTTPACRPRKGRLRLLYLIILCLLRQETDAVIYKARFLSALVGKIKM